MNESLYTIIKTADFLDHDKYDQALFSFEQQYGKIDHVIQRRAKSHKDIIILEVVMYQEPIEKL